MRPRGSTREWLQSTLIPNLFNWILASIPFILGYLAQTFIPLSLNIRFDPKDPTLSYPYSSSDSIDKLWIWLWSVLFPAIVILMVGCKRRHYESTHRALLGLTISVGLSYLLTQTTKNITSRPRPDFLNRCQPSFSLVELGGYNFTSHWIDLTNCEQPDSAILRSGLQSFPSHQASIPISGLGFLSLYLGYNLSFIDRPPRVYKLWVILTPTLLALYIGLAALMNHHHHPEDVLVGFIIGFTMAVLAYLSLLWDPFKVDGRSSGTTSGGSSHQYIIPMNAALDPFRADVALTRA